MYSKTQWAAGRLPQCSRREVTASPWKIKISQPIEVNHQKGHMALAHNGNLSNAAELPGKPGPPF